MTIARATHARPRPRPRAAVREPAAESREPVFLDAKAAILAAKDEIVAGLIEKAKGGSYLHAKFLFDFAGLNPAAEADAAAYAHEASLARLLLDQLTSEGISVPGYDSATAGPAPESV